MIINAVIKSCFFTATPSAEVESNRLEILSGTPVTLKCKVSGDPTPLLSWLRGRSMIRSDDGKFQSLVI